MNDDLNNLINVIERLQKEYLLINRIIYKVKNQFRRQRQFKMLVGLKNILLREVFNDLKLSSVLTNLSGFYNKVEGVKEKVTQLGEIIKEMLKLKLFVNYSVIILSILR
jgi:hypothetical protein